MQRMLFCSLIQERILKVIFLLWIIQQRVWTYTPARRNHYEPSGRKAVSINYPTKYNWPSVWLMPKCSLGAIDAATVEELEEEVSEEEVQRLERMKSRPPLSEILNLHDFEAIAKLVMPEKAWAYYSSAADDEITNRENHVAYHRWAYIYVFEPS